MTQFHGLVHANPTKRFFIFMLVKDIALADTIVDLIDNSVDAANRSRHDGDLKGLSVSITGNEHQFCIRDNCGGMTLETAQQYAFRFGRPEGFDPETGSIGQFGVGMKRAIFKLGRHAEVVSRHGETCFETVIDVDEWTKDEVEDLATDSNPDKSENTRTSMDWTFPYRLLELNERLLEAGVEVVITQLYTPVRKLLPHVLNGEVLQRVKEAHMLSIDKGLNITVNGIRIEGTKLELRLSESIKPVNIEKEFVAENGRKVRLKLFAGVGESAPLEAGWYIFCNDRLVVSADQSDLTGWGTAAAEAVPRYHNQYSRFRGYAFFESDDPTALPYNTTKVGVDRSSIVFISARELMLFAMRPVLAFLNKVDREIPNDDRPLFDALETAQLTSLSQIPANSAFESPSAIVASREATEATITFRRTKSEVEELKKVLGVASNRELGETCFDYTYEDHV